MTMDTMENVHTAGASREAVLREQLRRALSGQSRLEELLKHGRSHLMELRKQVEHAVAERDRATRELAELQAEHQRLSDERAEAESSLTAFLEQDVQRLQHELQVVTADRDDVTARLGARTSEMQQKDETAARQVEELRGKINILAAENATLKENEAQLERRVTAIEAKSVQLDEVLANRTVKLSAVEQTILQLEPLARLGRAAREVAKELRCATQSLDAHADRLLDVTPVASDCREDVEQLRAEAVRAHSLARQFLEDN